MHSWLRENTAKAPDKGEVGGLSPGPPFVPVGYRLLSQKPQPTFRPTSHCTICVPTPSAVRFRTGRELLLLRSDGLSPVLFLTSHRRFPAVAGANWILDRRRGLDVPLGALSKPSPNGSHDEGHQVFLFRRSCCRLFNAICLGAIATARWRKYPSRRVTPAMGDGWPEMHGESGMASS